MYNKLSGRHVLNLPCSDLLNRSRINSYDMESFLTGYNDTDEFSEEIYKITVEVGRINMGTKKQSSNEELTLNLECARALDRLKFEQLLDEFLSSELRHGKEIIDTLISLYDKGIISMGMVKKKAGVSHYELLSKLAQKGSKILPDICPEEEEDLKDLRGLFRC